MGNISHLWFIEGEGGDWASNACELDDCYSIPFAADDTMYLQAAIPDGYTAGGAWLTDEAGHRITNFMSGADNYKYYTDKKHLVFKVSDTAACGEYDTGTGTTTCVIKLLEQTENPGYLEILQNYLDGLQNTVITINIGGVFFDIDGTLPAGYANISTETEIIIQVPCDYNVTMGNTFQITSDIGNASLGDGADQLTEIETPVMGTLKCFHFEIPLMQDDVEVKTLRSEPFYCPECQPTLIVFGDYCLSTTDIFGRMIFNNVGMGASTGSLTGQTNQIRIQAVLKDLPSVTESSRNIRCNNFKSTLKERVKLQGAMPTDFPGYMVKYLESLFAAKDVYINGERYIPVSESIFIDRNVAGRSMKKLDVELEKCPQSVTFDCSCELPPCPEAIDYGMEVTPATNYTNTPNGDFNGYDHTFYRAAIDVGSITGGTAPYTLSDWLCSSGNMLPVNDIEAFDDTRAYNYFRRKEGSLCPQDISVQVKVTDANGCQWTAGLSIAAPDMRKVGWNGSLTIGTVTNNSIQITGMTPLGDCFDISKLSLTDGFPITGETAVPYTITGLAPNTEYGIVLRVWAACPAGDPNDDLCVTCADETCIESGLIGPFRVTTLP